MGDKPRKYNAGDKARKCPPPLRGFMMARIRRELTLALCFSALAGTWWHFYVANGNKAVYAEFYKDYDINQEFCDMVEKGVFDSCVE